MGMLREGHLLIGELPAFPREAMLLEFKGSFNIERGTK
jgi:hypothetical protein